MVWELWIVGKPFLSVVWFLHKSFDFHANQQSFGDVSESTEGLH